MSLLLRMYLNHGRQVKSQNLQMYLQLPAFLVRQTELAYNMAKTNNTTNIKKAQLLSWNQIFNIVDKFNQLGSDQHVICERDSNSGYDNLVVGMLCIGVMTRITCDLPVIFDVRHILLQRDPFNNVSGRPVKQVCKLSRTGIAGVLIGIFLQSPDRLTSKYDGSSALKLSYLKPFLSPILNIDKIVKAQSI